MKKKGIILIAALMLALTLSSCGTAAASDKVYTEMEEIQRYDDLEGLMLGLSPNGKTIAVWNDEEISLMDADTLDVRKTYDCKLPPKQKQAVWNSSGDAFILGDSYMTPNVLQTMQIQNISVFGPEDSKQVTDANERGKVMDGAALLFSPSWSADGNDLLYCSSSSKTSQILKIKLKSDDETNLFRSGKLRFVEGIELKDGLLLCEYNGSKAGDNDIFLYNVKNDEKTTLSDIVDSDDSRSIYEIKGWTDDRRTVLIDKWTYAGLTGETVLQKCMVLSFKANFKDYTIKTISYSFKLDKSTASQLGINPELADEKKGNNRIGYASILSPGGRYVITTDKPYDEVDSKLVPSNRWEIVLHDLQTGEDHILYKNSKDEEPERFGFSSPMNGNCASLFMSKDSKLMVWFDGGYRLFQLKP